MWGQPPSAVRRPRCIGPQPCAPDKNLGISRSIAGAVPSSPAKIHHFVLRAPHEFAIVFSYLTVPIITVTNVTKHFGRFAALRGVTAEFEQGHFYAILGDNGAGKTTLLRALAGLAHP